MNRTIAVGLLVALPLATGACSATTRSVLNSDKECLEAVSARHDAAEARRLERADASSFDRLAEAAQAQCDQAQNDQLNTKSPGPATATPTRQCDTGDMHADVQCDERRTQELLKALKD